MASGNVNVTVKWDIDFDALRELIAQLESVAEKLQPMVAVEAVAATVKAPVTRVFKSGDPEPADKETIALRGYGVVDGEVQLEYGDYGPKPSGENRWWARRDDPSDNTYAAWSFWLSRYGPLTEVL